MSSTSWIPATPVPLREHVVLDVPSFGMMPGGKVEFIDGREGKAPCSFPGPDARIVHPREHAMVEKIDPSTLPQSEGLLGAASAAATRRHPRCHQGRLERRRGRVGDGRRLGGHALPRVDRPREAPPLVASLSADEPTDAEMQKAKNKLEKLGMQNLPIDLWVDGDGFLKQAEFSRST